MITYQIEKWVDFVRDGQKLFPLHWDEVAFDKDKIKPAMNHPRYEELDNIGALQVLTARSGNRLAGYVICFLIPHMHYADAGLMALADMYFILPEFRKGSCGPRLFIEMEADLKRRGVVRAHLSCKVEHDHQPMFEKLGWTFTDKTFSKYIKVTPCQ